MCSYRLIGSFLSLFAGAVCLFSFGCNRPRTVAEPAGPEEDPRLTYDTPFRNVRPEVRYVGDQACADCHPGIAESYHQHPMAQTLSPIARRADELRYDQVAHNPFEALRAQFLVERRDGRIDHKEVHRDSAGQVVAETVAEIEFAIGSGTHAQSYLINRAGYLFQSPITWFAQKRLWDLSPTFAQRHDRFERPVLADCLFCHSNRALPVEHTVNRYQEPIFEGAGIGCERCHGPGALHVAARGRGEDPAGADHTIVNPRRLAPELREAVCQQCHLEGAVRVLRRGRQPFDFRPGLPLELFWSVFVQPAALANHKVVSSVEQLSLSRCYQASAGKLGCISCHDPHRLPRAEEKVIYYRDRCLQCHAETDCSLGLAPRREHGRADDCIRCHMPTVNASDANHVAITDHRIPRRPSEPAPLGHAEQPPSAAEFPLAYYPAFRSSLIQSEISRDLGLAIMQLAEPRQPEPSKVILAKLALPLLETAAQTWPDDVAAWEGKTYALWILGRVPEAQSSCQAVLLLAPKREISLVDAATLAELRDDRATAIGYWQTVLAVNPWPSRYHFQLANLYAGRKEWQKTQEECELVLRRNPANIEARLLLVARYAQAGERDRAQAEFDRILALHPPNPERLRRWLAQQLR